MYSTHSWVKANAYGHGMAEVAPAAAAHADWLAVHTAEEARRLRRLGLSNPVLIMGFIARGELHDLDADVHVFVSTDEVLRWLGEYRRSSVISLPIHLKIDTGTKRQGFERSRIAAACRAAAGEGLSIVGIATHFANIEDTLEHDFARRQLALFGDAVAALRRESSSDVPYVHAACSAASLLFRETDFNLARIGISMYGHWPWRETRLTWILDHGRKGGRARPGTRRARGDEDAEQSARRAPQRWPRCSSPPASASATASRSCASSSRDEGPIPTPSPSP